MLLHMEQDGGQRQLPGPGQQGARVLRLRPLRVLILSTDHRFRAVMAMLIARRGCPAFSASAPAALAETLLRERIDVLLVDGVELLRDATLDVERTDAAAPPIGVVLVGEPDQPASTALRSLAKWGAFGELFAAIVAADRARSRPPAPGPLPELREIRARRLG
jgi:hypothetical protein